MLSEGPYLIHFTYFEEKNEIYIICLMSYTLSNLNISQPPPTSISSINKCYFLNQNRLSIAKDGIKR